MARFFLSNSTYASSFMVLPWVTKYSPVLTELRIASSIIWLDGCFIVVNVYFSLNLFTGDLTCRVRSTSRCTGDSSDNKTLPNCQAVQSSHFLAKSKRLNVIAVVRHDLQAGLCDLRPSSLLRRCEAVIRLTFLPCTDHKQSYMYLYVRT